MNKALVAIAVLIGVVPANVPAATKQDDTLMILAGSDAALSAFERAARTCEVKGVSRIPAEKGKGTWVRVAGPPATLTSKPLNCLSRYVMSHMSGQNALSIIGNAAR